MGVDARTILIIVDLRKDAITAVSIGRMQLGAIGTHTVACFGVQAPARAGGNAHRTRAPLHIGTVTIVAVRDTNSIVSVHRPGIGSTRRRPRGPTANAVHRAGAEIVEV